MPALYHRKNENAPWELVGVTDDPDSGAVIAEHNQDTEAHGDIREMVENLTAEDVGAAPAGFGLGATSKYVNDCNHATVNGWYYTARSANAPENYTYGWMFVSTRPGADGDMIRQDYYAAIGNPLHYVRYAVDGVFGEWDCENPPMELGVEYRTTERFMGKPVYVRAISGGALTSATQKMVVVAAAAKWVISCVGFHGPNFNNNSPTSPYYSESGADKITFTCSAEVYNVTGQDRINVFFKTTQGESAESYAILKYTKESDY